MKEGWEVFKIGEICDIKTGKLDANAASDEMNTLASTMTSLESDISIANAALERLSAAAETAASSVGGLPGFSGINIDGSHAGGLDYVPFNGYLAELHQGEGVLTAAQNALFHSMLLHPADSYGSGISSDVLNAILGSNLQGVKAGGNVYLDGRTVGQVVSAMQGQAYRNLQRSGWQQ